MRYLPTINLWDPGVQTALLEGRLKLQCGQWVRCGQRRASRFVCLRPNRVIWAAHPEGKRGTGDSFRRLLTARGGVR